VKVQIARWAMRWDHFGSHRLPGGQQKIPKLPGGQGERDETV
jgi:hypothetical protein